MDKIFLALGALAILALVVVVGVAAPELESTRQQRAAHDAAMQAMQRYETEHWQENHLPAVQSAQRGASVVVLWGSGAALALALLGGASAVVARGWLWATSAHHIAVARIEASVEIARANNAHALPSAHYAPHISIAPHIAHATPAPALAATEEVAEDLALPGAVDLATLHHVPTTQNILLGLGAGGERITVPANNLVHVALSGATGTGKSNLARLLIAQLLAAGVGCVIANPHHADYDATSGEDWRAITARLAMPVARSEQDIAHLLQWLARDELARRLELRANGKRPGKPLVLLVDELPVITAGVAKAPELLGKLLREGRKVGLFLVGASQDFLVKTLGSSSGIRDCYRTAAYSGGDPVGAAPLLDIPQKEIRAIEPQLGQGVVLLRSTATTPPQLVRVPLASNGAVTRLLPGDSAACATSTNVDTCQPDINQIETVNGVAYTAPQSRKQASVEAERALALFHAGQNIAQVVLELRGIKSSQGAKYQHAASEVQALMREALAARGVAGDLV